MLNILMVQNSTDYFMDELQIALFERPTVASGPAHTDMIHR